MAEYRVRVYASKRALVKGMPKALSEKRFKESGLSSLFLKEEDFNRLEKEPLFLPIPGPRSKEEFAIADFGNSVKEERKDGIFYNVPIIIYSAIDG